MPVNADWLRRRNAIDQELGGHTADIADVRIVQHDGFRGSRERGACLRHWGTIGAGAANHFVGIKLDAIDGSAASTRNVWCWLHQFTCSQPLTIFLANRSVLTLTSENPIAPGFLDPDGEVVPRLFEIDFLNTDLPTGVGAGIQMFTSVAQGFSNYCPPPWLPGVFGWNNTNQQSLFLVGNTAATIFHYTVASQAVRE